MFAPPYTRRGRVLGYSLNPVAYSWSSSSCRLLPGLARRSFTTPSPPLCSSGRLSRSPYWSSMNGVGLPSVQCGIPASGNTSPGCVTCNFAFRVPALLDFDTEGLLWTSFRLHASLTTLQMAVTDSVCCTDRLVRGRQPSPGIDQWDLVGDHCLAYHVILDLVIHAPGSLSLHRRY